MKAILYFFAILFVILATFGFVMSRSVNLSMAADGVLILIKKGQFEQAYAFFTEDFQNRHPYGEFERDIKESGLSDYESVKWTKEELAPEGNRIFLAGVVTTKQNFHLLIELDYVKESFLSTWLINDLRIKRVSNE